MVNSRDLHAIYNKLYAAFREYIWDYETVECLADLEVSIYKLCPNLTDINRCLDKLDYRIHLADISDPELSDYIDMIYAALEDDTNGSYCRLSRVEERIHEN